MFDDAAKVEVSKKENVVYVPIEIEPAPGQFSPDGFHPAPSMYKELGRQVGAAIRSGLQSHIATLSSSYTP
jgi:lysophospholipase L1-like esterase